MWKAAAAADHDNDDSNNDDLSLHKIWGPYIIRH
jgi:hypothetical protein